jgi:phosphoglycolate phosphatase
LTGESTSNAITRKAVNLSLPAPKAIIFDWDNTLVDSWACIQASMNATLIAMGHPPWDMAETKARVAKSLRDSFPGLFGARWPEARDLFYREYRAIHLDYLKALDGAVFMLNRLSEAGVKLGVVSNKNGDLLRQEAAQLGWEGYFARLVGATDAVRDKPATAPITMVLDAVGLVPGPHVWFVGDAAIDMETAWNSGLFPLLLRDHPARDGEFGDFPPRLHLNSCRQLVDLVDKTLVPNSLI